MEDYCYKIWVSMGNRLYFGSGIDIDNYPRNIVTS